MATPLKVKVEPLSAEAMRRYGHMLENRQPVFPEVESGEGRVAIEMQHLKPRQTTHLSQMAVHFSYNQTFIPMEGSMVLVVAPAPRDRHADQATIEFDYDKVAAFLFKPGQAAFIEKGVWHNAFMFGERCTFINVTRKNPGEGTTRETGGDVALTHKRRPYVDFVDIEKRDNRVIELDYGIVTQAA